MKKTGIVVLLGIFCLCVGFRYATKTKPGGREIFLQRCAMCHNPNKGAVGPPFQGIRKDYAPAWIFAMVRNHDSMCKSADTRAQYVYKIWGRTTMNSNNTDLTDNEITSILDYVDSVQISKKYYRHRRMTEQELKAILNYLDRPDNGDFEAYLRANDSLKQI